MPAIFDISVTAAAAHSSPAHSPPDTPIAAPMASMKVFDVAWRGPAATRLMLDLDARQPAILLVASPHGSGRGLAAALSMISLLAMALRHAAAFWPGAGVQVLAGDGSFHRASSEHR